MLSDSFLAGFGAGLRGSPRGAYDAADPKDLHVLRREQHAEGVTALLARICDALKGKVDPRDPVLALINELAEHSARHPDAVTAGDQEGGPPPHPGAPRMGGMAGRLSADEVDEWKRFLLSKGLSAADVETAVRLLGATEGKFLGARSLEGGGIAADGVLNNPYYGSLVIHRPRGVPLSSRAVADRAVALGSRVRVDVFEAGRLAAADRLAPSARGRTPAPLAMDTSQRAADDYDRTFPGAAAIGKLD